KTLGRTSSNAYYNSLWVSTGDFTHSQFQDATEMVASAWYSAWIDAGSPALGAVPEPTALTTLSVGLAVLLAFALRRARFVTAIKVKIYRVFFWTSSTRASENAGNSRNFSGT